MKQHAIILIMITLMSLSGLSYAQAPVPFINLPLVPDATPPGGGDFTLTVNGTGFVPNSVVHWNGTALVTQFVSQSKLTAMVPAADIATASTASVTVVNPAPGGGTSNPVFFTVTGNKGNLVGFGPTTTTVTGPEPTAVVVGDFNGDGKLDLAVANWYGPVSVFLGDGTGRFTQTWSWNPGGSRISALAVGDFNGDGKLDLAVADLDNSTLSVFLGDGTGNFTLASTPPVGGYPGSVAVGDFNGDGKLDLAVANRGSNSASILLGDGTGNFTLASSPSIGTWAESLAVGDFNGDGKLDLAILGLNSTSILLGDGTGNFTLTSSEPYGLDCWNVCVVTGDFNGDGKLDLAIADIAATYIMLGDGKGNFALGSILNSDTEALAMGDFNGDGNLDLLLGSQNNQTLSLYLGDGSGNFTLASYPTVSTFPNWIAVGDFNGDGSLDMAVASVWWWGGFNVLQQGLPAVAFSPSGLSFGTQLVGASSTVQQVTLSNSGGADLSIASVATSANFYETNACASTLAPGASCTINVTFRPYQVGSLTGVLTVTDSAPTSPHKISLTGLSTAVTLWPSGLDFGDQPVGTTSPPRTVTFTNHASANSGPTNHGVGMVPWLNHGAGAVSIFGGQLTGSNPMSFTVTNNTCGQRVPPGGSCSFDVSFAPGKKGAYTATLEVNDDGGGSPHTVTLMGNGT